MKTTQLFKNSDQNYPEKRLQKRIQFLESDQMRLRTVLKGSEQVSFVIHNINSFGALVSCPKRFLKDLGGMSALNEVQIFYNETQIGAFEACTIQYVQEKGDELWLGLAFVQIGSKQSNTSQSRYVVEGRSQKRISVLENYIPYAWAQHSFIYDQPIHFNVHEISERGAQLSCSLRNPIVLRGTVFENLEILLPMVGACKVDAQVVHVARRENSDQLLLGMKFLKTESGFSAKLSKYLLNFGRFEIGPAIQHLRLAGLKSKYVKSHIDFSIVQNAKEYEAVLRLRKEAYARAGKVDEGVEAEDMGDIFDFNSVIVVAKLKDEVIGSVRVTYCKNPSDQFELDHSITIPANLPRDKSIEISRLCVSNAFQSTDLVLGLVERCTEIGLKMKMKYVITSCVKEMLPYYDKLGFKQTGITFELKTLNAIPHYFITLDVRKGAYAHRMNPLYWWFTYRNISAYLMRHRFIQRRKLPMYKKMLVMGVLWLRKMVG